MDDKRQYTGVPVVSADAHLINPTQLIWGGKGPGCTPDLKTKCTYATWVEHEFSETHWTTLETLQRLLVRLHRDYVMPKKKEMGLSDDQKWILLLDVRPPLG